MSQNDDLYGPTLSATPSTAVLARGAMAAVVTVSLAVAGCGGNPGLPNPGVSDAGVSIAPDGGTDGGLNPGLPAIDAGQDAAPGVDAGFHPGVPALDAGVDADNPGDHT